MADVRPLSFTLRITNNTPRARTLVLEPWAGEYRLLPGVPLDVVVEGTPTAPLELELDEDRLVLFSFPTTDAMLTAYREGRKLRSEHDVADA